ncbi:MAG: SDR family oxidoreductase [Armatimonadetes bacterium]|nr:SDR family oxidoreductase [Armatimonadota bacterium]
MSEPMRPHVIVSGGSRGLGGVLVGSLLESGYRVSTFSRRTTPFVESLAVDPDFYFREVDVANRQQLASFVTDANKSMGTSYGLINCAGLAVSGVLATMGADTIDHVLRINLAGSLHLTRLVVRCMMLEDRGGVIVNISSIVGLRGFAGLATYAASKGGMDAMTRALARELGPRNIRVNSVAPGYLDTEMTHGLSDEQRLQIVRRTPLGRLGTPADLLGSILFLLSPAAAFVTGQVLVVDGGITA